MDKDDSKEALDEAVLLQVHDENKNKIGISDMIKLQQLLSVVPPAAVPDILRFISLAKDLLNTPQAKALIDFAIEMVQKYAKKKDAKA